MIRPLLLVLVTLTGACSSQPLLADTRPSDEAVARAVLDALERRDHQALLRLALTRREFEEVVWPALPASRPDVGMPVAYVWQDTAPKSRGHLQRTLEQWGGQRLRLVRLEFGGPTTDYGRYSVSRKARLVVRDEAGRERHVRLFGSIVRTSAGSKVYSYIVD